MARHIAATFFTPEFVASRPERVEWLVDAFWEHRPELREYLRHVIARQEHQTADRLTDILAPSLVLIGDRDRHQGGTGVHWEQSAYLAEHLPDVELDGRPRHVARVLLAGPRTVGRDPAGVDRPALTRRRSDATAGPDRGEDGSQAARPALEADRVVGPARVSLGPSVAFRRRAPDRAATPRRQISRTSRATSPKTCSSPGSPSAGTGKPPPTDRPGH